MKNKYVVAATGAVALMLTGGGAQAQNDTTITQQPEAQIVVAPDMQGAWLVSMVYPKQVPRVTAEGRAKRLAGLARWKIGELTFEDRALEATQPVSGTKPGEKMSSVTFRTTAMLVDFRNGTLTMEPFASALRDLSRVNITYLVPGNFVYRGPRRYSDNNIRIVCGGEQSTYNCYMEIKNHQATRFPLPQFEPAVPEKTRRATVPATSNALKIGMVALAAMGTGLLVYAIVNRYIVK
jgi:hypothetical protein